MFDEVVLECENTGLSQAGGRKSWGRGGIDAEGEFRKRKM